MSTTTMHFGPEWMRPKQQSNSRPQQPPSLPPANPALGAISTYSALVSPAPPNQAGTHDEAHPFRYTKEDLFRIFKESGKIGLGLEVERWEGVVREYGGDPVGLREMGEAEKKLFAGPLNSDVRRRQSTDYLSPLSTTNLNSGGARLNHNSTAVGSPMRERFGNLKRRDSNADSPNSALPRKQSLSSLQPPTMSPREIGNPMSRTRVGYTPGFDGVLTGGDSRVARRRAAEASQKSGGNTTGFIGDGDINESAEDIKEEIQEESSGNLTSVMPGPQDSSSSASNNACNSKDVNNLTGGLSHLSLTTNISNPIDNTQVHSTIGAPPGLADIASVEWSYKDPTGTIQGPFSAELMQGWYDDGYFTPDLPMKRTHLDTTWSTVDQLRRRCTSDRIFLTPLHAAPPGLSIRNGSPIQYNGSDQTMNGPYQPAPLRSLRTSALESYISTGSNHSESPSSSFGAGRFGDSSPEPNAFSGRVAGSQFYNGDPTGSARSSGFQTTPEIPAAFSSRRGLHPESPVEGPMGMRSGPFGTYGYSNPFGSAQSPWGTPINNFGSGYEAMGPIRDTHDHSGLPNYSNSGMGLNYGNIRNPQDLTLDTTMNYTAGSDHSARVLDHQYAGLNVTLGASDQLYSHVLQQFDAQQHISSPNPLHPQQEGLPTPSTQQLPWPDPSEPGVQRDRLFDNSQPIIDNTITQSQAPSQTSAWDQQQQVPLLSPIPIPKDASPWVVASHGTVDSAWGEPADDRPANAEPEAEVEAHQSPVDQAPAGVTAELLEELKTEPETIEAAPTPAPVVLAPPTSGKPRKQREPKSPSAPALAPQLEVLSPQISTSKPAWQKDDEAKKAISLREIQEAESRKTEAKKAAERERDRTARAAVASSQDKEDIQAFTASWGLPTSQAGSRGGQIPVKEATSISTTPVWTNASKIAPAKKTMKEILEEEERRKKVTPQVTAALAVAASTPKRLYAESSAKPSTSVTSGGAWTTVGPNGKSNTVVAVASPSRLGASNVSATSHANGSTPVRPTQLATSKPASAPTKRADDTTPSHEFLSWLNDTLKGLNNSVSVEEIMHMLLSFPIEADASIREIISETIYTNSTTMDGRRFAEEFVSRRKADASINAKSAGASKTPAKPISIADVVKAAPKTTQPEWGFKVVNKKKKGGRS